MANTYVPRPIYVIRVSPTEWAGSPLHTRTTNPNTASSFRDLAEAERHAKAIGGTVEPFGGPRLNRAKAHRSTSKRDARSFTAYARVVYNRLRRKGMPADLAAATVHSCAAQIRAAKRAGKSTTWVANKCFAAAAFSRRRR